MFIRNITLKELEKNINSVDQELGVYLSTKSSVSLNSFMEKGEGLSNLIKSEVNKITAYTEEDQLILDIDSMIYNYMVEANKAVEEKRKEDVAAHTQRYKNAKNIKSYILEYIQELNIRQLNSNATTYIYMSRQIQISTLLNIILIIDLILLSVIIIIRMTDSMINPIIKLSHSAEDISKGRFHTDEIIVESNDEIKILALAFNNMKRSIHAYIEELKEKAQTEAKLNFQQMENLKMQSLLDNAKLFALQSQMNPHFLFNTINAGVQLSMIEGAERTSEFLECMSRLFRYNIKQLDKAVTMRDELANVNDYYELIKVRFGDLITFNFFIEIDSLDYSMPPLILQPLVENAYIHGLSKKEEGGIINISVNQDSKFAYITIEDNGMGMTMSKQKELNALFDRHTREAIEVDMEKNKKKAKMVGHSNGIGLRNVAERLELFFKYDRLISVKGSKGQGCKFTVRIPLIRS
jgi:two-component system, sensor histidine kinase YesM